MDVDGVPPAAPTTTMPCPGTWIRTDEDDVGTAKRLPSTSFATHEIGKPRAGSEGLRAIEAVAKDLRQTKVVTS